MARALVLARRGIGRTSPNPAVGAVLVRGGQVIGEGWHRHPGGAHAEVEALADAHRRGSRIVGATLYVTLEPCSTHGRTPPCTVAIIEADIAEVVIGANDPNPRHAGRAVQWLRRRGVRVITGVLKEECVVLNASFNRWIVHRLPLVTVKAAMTLDGKIATPGGESQWITGTRARAHAMRLRRETDAIVVGVGTVLADDPSLTVRSSTGRALAPALSRLRRIILDSQARTPLKSRVVADDWHQLTTVVVTAGAPAHRVKALQRRVRVIRVSASRGRVSLPRLLRRLGSEEVTKLLVEGGGEVQDAFFRPGLVQEIAFYYAPKILGGERSIRAVGGVGARLERHLIPLVDVRWSRLGGDLLMTAAVAPQRAS